MLSFILINYNTKELTYNAIKSIVNSFAKSNNYEIIIVDNNSNDGSKEFFTLIGKKNENLKYIYNNENVGFGRAINIAFKKSAGNYLFLINTDAKLITKNVDEIIEEIFKRNSKTAIIAPEVFYPDGSKQTNTQSFTNLSAIIYKFINLGRFVRQSKFLIFLIKKIPFLPKNIKNYLNNFSTKKKETEVDWASGCGLIIKSQTFKKLNGFDDNFFMYFEDEDLCIRTWQINQLVIFSPEIQIIHEVGGSDPGVNKNKIIQKFRSENYLYKKHYKSRYIKYKIIYIILDILLFPFSRKARVLFKPIFMEFFKTNKINNLE